MNSWRTKEKREREERAEESGMDGDFCFSLALPETRCGSPSSPLPLSIPSSAAAFAHALDWTLDWPASCLDCPPNVLTSCCSARDTRLGGRTYTIGSILLSLLWLLCWPIIKRERERERAIEFSPANPVVLANWSSMMLTSSPRDAPIDLTKYSDSCYLATSYAPPYICGLAH